MKPLAHQYVKALVHAYALRAENRPMSGHELAMVQRNIEALSSEIAAAEVNDRRQFPAEVPTPPPEKRFWYAMKEALAAMTKAIELEAQYQHGHDSLSLILRTKYEDAVRTAHDYLTTARGELQLR
jgi:hypothetical protein